ncbi:MAG TPA: hypothetical protein VEC13_00915 [Candidatus Paceibacterota bacterium]|nr:hypothetical protein [Candidatus Paceibacterota bacterium]
MQIGTHHAYVIEGEIEETLASLKEWIHKSDGIEIETSPDILEFHFPSFQVEHSRTIREADLKSPFSLQKKAILISFDTITREAQNALLKVLEDPSPTSRFYILTERADIFLPTMLSRVEVLRHESFGRGESPIDVERFIKSSSAKRLEMVSSLLKDIADEKLPKKAAKNFLRSLARTYEQRVASGNVEEMKKLKSVLEALSFVSDKSASLKLLLERVALC